MTSQVLENQNHIVRLCGPSFKLVPELQYIVPNLTIQTITLVPPKQVFASQNANLNSQFETGDPNLGTQICRLGSLFSDGSGYFLAKQFAADYFNAENQIEGKCVTKSGRTGSSTAF